MTKDEAIEALKQGKKLAHSYFNSKEYIYMDNGILFDEHDCYLDSDNFWSELGTARDNDWFILNK